MTEPKTRGGKREGSGRKPKGAEAFPAQLLLRITQRQADYLGCAAILSLDPQDLVRMALDKWIDEQAGAATE